jgi:hypothetical protein
MVACRKSESGIYEFNPENIIGNKMDLSEIADDIFYVPLDNRYPISLIYKIFFTKEAIYLNTRDVGILKFTLDGKLVTKIGSIGRGPSEYTNYLNFAVDVNKETVYVKDRHNRIQEYSGNGAFLKTLNINDYGGTIELISIFNSKLFVFNSLPYGNAKYNWIILDTLGSLIKTKVRPDPIFDGNYSGRSETYFASENLCYWNTYNDTVYAISPELTERASFLIDNGKFRIPRGYFKPTDNSYPHLFIRSIFETEQYFVIKYLIVDKEMVALVNKKNQSTYVWEFGNYFTKGGIINNIDGGTDFIPSYCFTKDGSEYFIGTIEAFKIKTHISSDTFHNSKPKYPEKKKELEKLANSLKETDNPVLMIVRLKK